MHMPKTGGTSLRQILNSAFAQDEIFPNRREMKKYNGYPPVNRVLALSKQDVSGRKLLRGHYPFALSDHLFENARRIVFLRPPIERALSFLFHMQRRHPQLSIEEIIDKKAKKLKNRQVQFFADDGPPFNVFNKSEVDRDDFELALANLNQCWFVGLTDCFDESVALLAQRLGVENLKMKERNKGAYKSASVSQTVIDKLHEMNQFDLALYDQARLIFNSQWSESNLKLPQN